MNARLLIVEDDEGLCTQMKWALAGDYEVHLAEDRASALSIVREDQPSVVLLDLGLPPQPDEVEEGFRTMADILHEDPLIKVSILTGMAEKEYAIEAIGQGAYDFLSKPIEIDVLKVILKRAFYISGLERETHRLEERFAQESFAGILGTSPQMERVYTMVRKTATTDVPVLIVGESGTGKELVVQAIHKQSDRREYPFIVVNSAAIPETLLESELFGHEKGAFTGAHIQRRGLVEKAQGGTLFLDEIGDLSPSLQVKLLRFLQEYRIERVGGREEIEVDCHVIAATNRDLEKAIKEGRFREDLYHRIGTVVISLPPFRERKGDIELLARTFLHRYATENKKRIKGFTFQALRALEKHSWPGNVRELENRINRAVIMAEGPIVTPEDLELGSPFAKYEGLTLEKAIEALDTDLIQESLRRHKGNITKVAAELGLGRRTLYDLMEKRGIQRKQGVSTKDS